MLSASFCFVSCNLLLTFTFYGDIFNIKQSRFARVFSAFETGSCSEDEKVFLTVHKPHPAVKTEEYYILSSFFISDEKKGSFFMKAKKHEQSIFSLTCIALLIAMQVVLARFGSIPVGTMRFSLSFIPVVIAARRFGVLSSVLVYGLGDLIGAIAFPTTGAYMPGFTITALISGLIFGLFLSKKSTVLRIAGAVLSSQIICSLLLNSYWLWTYYYSAEKVYSAILLSRVPQSIVTGIVQIVFMTLFLEKICKIIKIPQRG